MELKTFNKTYSPSDLLTSDELETIITSIYTEDKAELIANKVSKYFFINGENLYRLQANDTYKIMDGDLKDKLITTVSNYLSTSAKALSDVMQQNLNLKYKKEFVSTFSNSKIATYVLQLKEYFLKDIKLDLTLDEIHFNNGYMDLKDLVFKQRDLTKHYITKYINRDYKPSKKKTQNKVLSEVKKIIPNKNDLDSVLAVIGSSLTGKSYEDQTTMFILGNGSAGKSLFMSLTQLAIECYFVELNSNTFSIDNKNKDKILNSYSNQCQIRISWLNEPKDTKMDISLFKTYCEGQLQTVELYKDGMNNFRHYSKLIGTSNTMPNIHIDSGSSRRLTGITCTSRFTDNKDEVNESEHVYLKNEKLLKELDNPDLLNAWFDVLAVYAHKWTNGEKVKYSDNFKETKSTILSTNDTTQDFIDAMIEITNDPKDRIGKQDMMTYFKAMYPNKFVSAQQLLGDLKNHNIRYEAQARCNRIQGCYVGVKLKDIDDDDDDEVPPVTNVNVFAQQSNQELEELRKENKILSDQIAKLNKKADVKNIPDIKRNLENRATQRIEETEFMLSFKFTEPKNSFPEIKVSDEHITLDFDNF